jgi:hypothetical protein
VWWLVAGGAAIVVAVVAVVVVRTAWESAGWRRVYTAPSNFQILALVAVGPNEVYGYFSGAGGGTADANAEDQDVDGLLRWDGHRWSYRDDQHSIDKARALHRARQRQADNATDGPPYHAGPLDNGCLPTSTENMINDGGGGLWLISTSDHHSRYVHYQHGECTSVAVPDDSHDRPLVVEQLTRVPGTQTVYALVQSYDSGENGIPLVTYIDEYTAG